MLFWYHLNNDGKLFLQSTNTAEIYPLCFKCPRYGNPWPVNRFLQTFLRFLNSENRRARVCFPVRFRAVFSYKLTKKSQLFTSTRVCCAAVLNCGGCAVGFHLRKISRWKFLHLVIGQENSSLLCTRACGVTVATRSTHWQLIHLLVKLALIIDHRFFRQITVQVKQLTVAFIDVLESRKEAFEISVVSIEFRLEQPLYHQL